MEWLSTFVISLAVLVVSVVLHEMAHGVVAYWLGDDTAKEAGRLSLNPLKHIDPVMSILVPMVMFLMRGPIFGGAKPVPINTRNLRFREWGMALVAIAGPLTNFVLAFLSVLVIQVFPLNALGVEIALTFVYINLGFFVFNLIPIPPLDGSRILFALSPEFLKEILLRMEQYGMVIMVALVVIFGGALSNFLITAVNSIISMFVWILGG
jgi:Zn-dependent protease